MEDLPSWCSRNTNQCLAVLPLHNSSPFLHPIRAKSTLAGISQTDLQWCWAQVMGADKDTTSAEDIFDFGLYLIDDILHDSGHTLSDFPSMPQPMQNWTSITHNRLIAQQMNYDPQSESMLAHVQIDSLNSHQRSAFDRIWQSILGKQGKMFFLEELARHTFTKHYAMPSEHKISLWSVWLQLCLQVCCYQEDRQHIPCSRSPSTLSLKIPCAIFQKKACMPNFWKQQRLSSMMNV